MVVLSVAICTKSGKGSYWSELKISTIDDRFHFKKTNLSINGSIDFKAVRRDEQDQNRGTSNENLLSHERTALEYFHHIR